MCNLRLKERYFNLLFRVFHRTKRLPWLRRRLLPYFRKHHYQLLYVANLLPSGYIQEQIEVVFFQPAMLALAGEIQRVKSKPVYGWMEVDYNFVKDAQIPGISCPINQDRYALYTFTKEGPSNG